MSPVFGGIPATEAIARNATNIKNWGRTPISGIIQAITLMLIILFFGKLSVAIPMATLAAILIVVSYNMSELTYFIKLFKSPKSDVSVLLPTFLLTVFIDLTVAIEIGMVLSAFLFIKRMADVTGGAFFRATDKSIESLFDINYTPEVLILKMNDVSVIDATCFSTLKHVVRKYHHKKITLILSGFKNVVINPLKNLGFLT
ncbi:SulP family inorganic anion transporter [uncultured Ilyobacter sp.]|uniref:SulP family inorganic anion transporter n=1 Tax=uncultured Ilyobacter sp. TaxID=544433 RepID=UPI0029C94535|nr:SulP family inorganic anion transporter [uncultured Ilyobacter sp.]